MNRLVIFLLGAALGMFYTHAVYNIPTPMDAYDICMSAHNETAGASEQKCGEALDKAGLVFLCNKAGTICWTERI